MLRRGSTEDSTIIHLMSNESGDFNRTKKYKEKSSSWQVFRLQFLIQHFRSKWIRIEGFSLLKVSSTLARKC
jgi:hypothetical protein